MGDGTRVNAAKGIALSSAAATATVWAASLPLLPKMLLLALIDEWGDRARFSARDVPALATKLSMSPAQVGRALQPLIDLRVLQRMEIWSDGSNSIQCWYRLCLDHDQLELSLDNARNTKSVLVAAARFFQARHTHTPVWRRRLKRYQSGLDSEYVVEITSDLCLRVLDAPTSNEVARSAPGMADVSPSAATR